jgi:CheY-like chemotaxis protein
MINGASAVIPLAMPKPSRTIRVLIVEDDQLVAVDLEGRLERLGYQVADTAASGEEACARATELQPDLILMDVRLAGAMDGIEAAQRIRQVCTAPVVFLTAYCDATTLERAKCVEPYGYLVKPIVPGDLHAALQMAIHKGDVDRALRENHENLLAILNAQRHGTIMLDGDLRIRFASVAACRMAGICEVPAQGQLLTDFLPLSAEQTTALRELLACPPEQRAKLPLVLDADGPRPRSLEFELLDDPRHDGGSILFLYDVSPLVDLRRQLDAGASLDHIIGKSAAMRHVFQIIQNVARVDPAVVASSPRFRPRPSPRPSPQSGRPGRRLPPGCG